MKYILLSFLFLISCEKAQPIQKEEHVVTVNISDDYPNILKNIDLIIGNDIYLEDFKEEYSRTFIINKDTYLSLIITADKLFKSKIEVLFDGKCIIEKYGTCTQTEYRIYNYLINI